MLSEQERWQLVVDYASEIRSIGRRALDRYNCATLSIDELAANLTYALFVAMRGYSPDISPDPRLLLLSTARRKARQMVSRHIQARGAYVSLNDIAEAEHPTEYDAHTITGQSEASAALRYIDSLPIGQASIARAIAQGKTIRQYASETGASKSAVDREWQSAKNTLRILLASNAPSAPIGDNTPNAPRSPCADRQQSNTTPHNPEAPDT